MKTTFALLASLLCYSQASQATSKEFVFYVEEGEHLGIPADLIRPDCLDADKGVLHQGCAERVIGATVGAEATSTTDAITPVTGPNDRPKDPYYVIHVVKWKKRETTQAVEAQHWYVYHAGDWTEEDFSVNDRIFGKRQIVFVYFHLNRDVSHTYGVRYTIKTEKKTPAFIDHFTQLVSLVLPSATESLTAPTAKQNVYAVHVFEDLYSPSNLTITPELVDEAYDEKPVTETAQLDSHVFDDEGLYHTDFSAGLPFKKFSELQYVSTSNTLVPAKIEREKLFAFFNFYPKAIDVKSAGLHTWPYLVTGVGIGSKPLQKIVLAAGYGPLLANFYAGVLFNTQRLPKSGSCGKTPTEEQAAGGLANKTCLEFTIGLNISVGSVLDSMKKK